MTKTKTKTTSGKNSRLRQLLEEQQQRDDRAQEILARIRTRQDRRGIRPLVETCIDFTEQKEWMNVDQQWGYFYALLERVMNHHE